MKNSRTLFIGIFAAATAGVIIGMLIAPEKGENLRKNIKDAAGDWTKKLGDLLAEGKEQFKNLTASLQEEASGLNKEDKSSSN
jgi:gas vesicle protein